jgi:hypothetical protein
MSIISFFPASPHDSLCSFPFSYPYLLGVLVVACDKDQDVQLHWGRREGTCTLTTYTPCNLHPSHPQHVHTCQEHTAGTCQLTVTGQDNDSEDMTAEDCKKVVEELDGTRVCHSPVKHV